MKHFYVLMLTNMVIVWQYEVMSDKFNMIEVCTTEN